MFKWIMKKWKPALLDRESRYKNSCNVQMDYENITRVP